MPVTVFIHIKFEIAKHQQGIHQKNRITLTMGTIAVMNYTIQSGELILMKAREHQVDGK